MFLRDMEVVRVYVFDLPRREGDLLRRPLGQHPPYIITSGGGLKHLIRQADHPARHRLLRTGQLVAALVALLLLLTVATAAAGYDIWRMLAE